MATISERLRATGGKGQCGPIKAEAADTIDALVAALERAQEDVNWMLNEGRFLNAGVFHYIDTALALTTPKETSNV